MNWAMYLLKLFGFALVIIILYNILKIYVLSKYNPNKWIVFGLAFAVLTIPSMIKPGFNQTIGGIVTSAIFVVLFMWFFDMFNEERIQYKKKGKDIKIRPKAKPNRVKNKQEIDNK